MSTATSSTPGATTRSSRATGTIGLELVEDLDRFDAVLIPWGGGGLTTGIASAVKALRPETKVYVCEPETGAPVAAAIANGGVPTKIDYTPSFIDGAGSGALLPEMWAHAKPLVTDAFSISLDDAAAGVRLLLEPGASWEKERRDCPLRPLSRDEPGVVGSSASSPAGTSTRTVSPRSSKAGRPD